MAIWATAQEPSPGAWDKMRPLGADTVVDPAEYDKSRSLYQAAFNDSMAWRPNAVASTYGGSTIGRDDLDARKFQDANIARLQSIAGGGAGGVATDTAYRNLAAGAARTNALAASRPTTNAAMAMRTAGNTNQATAARAANSIAGLKAQEQLAAYAALDPALSSMRAGDFGVASEQAKLQAATNLANAGNAQAVALANQDARNRQQAAARAAYAGLTGNDASFYNAKMAEYRAIRGDDQWNQQWNMEKQNRRDAQNAAYLNTLGSGMSMGANYASEYNKDWYKKHPSSGG